MSTSSPAARIKAQLDAAMAADAAVLAARSSARAVAGPRPSNGNGSRPQWPVRSRGGARARRGGRRSPIRRSCPSRSAPTRSRAAIREHQVVIVCGETGSGKTTQLPKICLDARPRPGNGGGLIGHTQPRRIAASSVAKRIAEELKTPLGEVVGYKVRFQDRLAAGRLASS